MRRQGSLRLLFETVALATFAAGCGAVVETGGSGPSTSPTTTPTTSPTTPTTPPFTTNACERDGTYRPAVGLRVAGDPAYVALRNTYEGSGSTQTLSETGTPCLGAVDAAACKKELEAMPNAGWLRTGGGGEIGPERRWLVATSGDRVLHATTIEELRKLVAPVDGPKDAALLATEPTGRIDCSAPNVRVVAGGYDVRTLDGFGCGSSDDIVERIVRVAADGTTTVVATRVIEKGNPNCAVGRRPEGFAIEDRPCEDLGAFLAQIAQLEAASVPAFARLRDELRAHGAPRDLIAGAERARRDEIRHARMMRSLARGHGVEVDEVAIDELPIRDLEAIAVEDAVEGCVRETYGALVATFQAKQARDPRIAAVMARIAEDETRHAELSWSVLRWALERLDDDARARVSRATSDAAAALRAELAAPAPTEAIERAGMPSPEVAIALFDRVAPELWA
jgi:hypothetical protein